MLSEVDLMLTFLGIRYAPPSPPEVNLRAPHGDGEKKDVWRADSGRFERLVHASTIINENQTERADIG